MKNQAGPAQDPWPPKPSRSGPGPLAPQAKTKPVRPRTLGPPSQNQAGPAQDPWPPKPNPSRSDPGPLAPQAKRNESGPIGNTIKKESGFPDTPFEDISIFLKMFMKKG